MTSKKLGHSYSRRKRTFENLVIRSLNVVEKRKLLRKSSEKNPNRKPVHDFKIRIWTQIEISKLGSGASSSLVGFRGLAFDKISSEEGV
jgi:hypothetical protein